MDGRDACDRQSPEPPVSRGLWGLRPYDGRIDVTAPLTRTKRPGLLLHRAVLAEDEITTEQGIPVTTPARTQLDLAGVLQRHHLQQAINEAERQRTLRVLAPPTHTSTRPRGLLHHLPQ